jgi:DNA-binding NarL/FixJ family response regulator
MVPFRNEATAVAATTVLLIDDNDEDRKYWGEVLKKSSLNYMVLEASSGDAGLDLCRSHQIDCVVLDLDMQESGFHALFNLISDRKRPEIAVVILTHLPHPNLLEMAMHNGAQACLIKQTTSAEDLDNAIQTAVASVKAKRQE